MLTPASMSASPRSPAVRRLSLGAVSPHGELFRVLIDPLSDSFVIQVDAPENGPSFEVSEARAGHVLLSIPRDDDGHLAEVRQFPRGRVNGRLTLGRRQPRVARTRLPPGIAPGGFEPPTSRS